jgi:hypothetical protein
VGSLPVSFRVYSEQTEDFVNKHKEIAIEERNDRRKDGWHAQMFKRMHNIGEARH